MSTQSNFHFRSASPSDTPSIASLHVRSFVATYDHLPETRRAAGEHEGEWEAVWSRRLGVASDDHTTLVATTGNEIVGFVYIGPSPDPDDDPRRVGQILSIHVDPASTGRGVGRALMAEAIRTLRTDGYRTASLWVVDTNTRAKDFYERLGWQHDGARNTQRLSIDAKTGDEVEVVRYRLPLATEEIG
ncbi:MAG TPA: GNAT family N-acetyltransferase [Acidimicrobiia bacterium]|nr:GNAT family N-acetyltransferase [Acidimicrobiia bacterium]